MEKIELGNEYKVEIGRLYHYPIMLRKEDIRCMLTDIINNDVTPEWCYSCNVKKEAGIPIPSVSDYEPEAEALANGGTLNFELWYAFENEVNGGAVDNYELTLENFIDAASLNIDTIDNYLKKRITKYDESNKEYHLNMERMNEDIEDTIVQTALFDRVVFFRK